MKKEYSSLKEVSLDYQFSDYCDDFEDDVANEIMEYMFMNNVDAEEAVKAVVG